MLNSEELCESLKNLCDEYNAIKHEYRVLTRILFALTLQSGGQILLDRNLFCIASEINQDIPYATGMAKDEPGKILVESGGDLIWYSRGSNCFDVYQEQAQQLANFLNEKYPELADQNLFEIINNEFKKCGPSMHLVVASTAYQIAKTKNEQQLNTEFMLSLFNDIMRFAQEQYAKSQ